MQDRSIERFLWKLPFFQKLSEDEKKGILEENVPVGVMFQKCTFFNPSNRYNSSVRSEQCLSSGYNLPVQLSALLGHKEVEKLRRKLDGWLKGLGEMAVNTFKFDDLFWFPLHVGMDR